MGYADYLKNLLDPLKVYQLNAGYGAGELHALGSALDMCNLMIESLEVESMIATAGERGISYYHRLVPYMSGSTLDEKRKSLHTLVGAWNRPATNDVITALLIAVGINAKVEESTTPQTIKIAFDVTPENMDAAEKIINMIIPCHLGITYGVFAVTWDTLETAFATWNAIEGKTFSYLERYK